VVSALTLEFSDLEICFCELRRVDGFPLGHGIRIRTAGLQVSTDKRVCGQVTPRWSVTLPLRGLEGRVARDPIAISDKGVSGRNFSSSHAQLSSVQRVSEGQQQSTTSEE